MQTTLDGSAKIFSFLLKQNISDWKHEIFQTFLPLEKTNNIKEFYAMKFADFQMKLKITRCKTRNFGGKGIFSKQTLWWN